MPVVPRQRLFLRLRKPVDAAARAADVAVLRAAAICNK
jgi:hypothetical protein